MWPPCVLVAPQETLAVAERRREQTAVAMGGSGARHSLSPLWEHARTCPGASLSLTPWSSH